MSISLKDMLAQSRAIKTREKLNLPPAKELGQVEKQPTVADLVSADVSAAPTTPKPVTEAEQAAMPELLGELANMIDSPLVSTALSKVLIHIHSFPETRELLRPEDIGLLVRACAKSHGATIAAKEKRSTTKSKRQTKVDEAAAMLADLDF